VGGSYHPIGPYRFFFYANDIDEPTHIHVQRDRYKAKFWLKPVRLQQSGGFSRNEINRIQKLIESALVRWANERYECLKEFSSSGGIVRYDVQGSGPPLVLVHGTPWSSFNWRHIIPALAQWWTVYYYDLLGYGQSEKRSGQDVSLGAQNNILEALLEYWGLDAPLIIGHDFGGTTVLRTHLLCKRNFQKIVLIDPVALAPWGSSFFVHVKEHQEVFEGLPAYIHEALVSAYVRGATFKPMTAETLNGIIKPWLGPEGQSAFYRQIGQADQRFTDEIEPMYRSISLPVLILWGERDEWIPISRGRQLNAAIPASEFYSIPDAGHLVQEDAPAMLVSHIIKFFAR
jgi:pimeloyl-ACP methyl ester carboxylesterase